VKGRTDEGAKRPVTRRARLLAARAPRAVYAVRCFVTLAMWLMRPMRSTSRTWY